LESQREKRNEWRERNINGENEEHYNYIPLLLHPPSSFLTKAIQSIPGYFTKQSKQSRKSECFSEQPKHSKYFLDCFDCFGKHSRMLSKAAKAFQVFSRLL